MLLGGINTGGSVRRRAVSVIRVVSESNIGQLLPEVAFTAIDKCLSLKKKPSVEHEAVSLGTCRSKGSFTR